MWKHKNLAKSCLGTKSPKPIVVTVKAVTHMVSDIDMFSYPSIWRSNTLIVKAKNMRLKASWMESTVKGLMLIKALYENQESAETPLL